jgi:hypothetical protein
MLVTFIFSYQNSMIIELRKYGGRRQEGIKKGPESPFY